jgi:hypothetical protein
MVIQRGFCVGRVFYFRLLRSLLKDEDDDDDEGERERDRDELLDESEDECLFFFLLFRCFRCFLLFFDFLILFLLVITGSSDYSFIGSGSGFRPS